MQTIRWAGLAFGVVLAGAVETASATTISSDFSSDTDGWTQSGASVFNQQASGGNPGGFLLIDNSEGPVTFIFAPAKFLGDLRAFDGGTFSFDGIQLQITGTPWTSTQDYGHLRILGPSGASTSAKVDLVPAPNQPSGSWTTYSVTLTAASFGVTQAQWTNILSNVTGIELSVEAVFGGEIEGVDNVVMTSVPEPSAAALFVAGAIGLAGWGGRARQSKRES